MQFVDETYLNNGLTSIANSIRTKGGTAGTMAFPAGFVSAVNAIPSGGTIDPNVPVLLSALDKGFIYYIFNNTNTDVVSAGTKTWSNLSQMFQTAYLIWLGVASTKTDDFINNGVTPYLCDNHGIQEMVADVTVGSYLAIMDYQNYPTKVFLADATWTDSDRHRDAVDRYFTAINTELT